MSSSISFKIQAPPRPSSSSTARPPVASSSRARPSALAHRNNDDPDDDSDEDDAFATKRKSKDQLVTAFDSNGATQYDPLASSSASSHQTTDSHWPSSPIRKHPRPASNGPLVIPALPNKDWREAAELIKKKKQQQRYIPDAVGGMRLATGSSAQVDTQVASSADTINSEPVVGGLAIARREETVTVSQADLVERRGVEQETVVEPVAQQETEEQRALRELIQGGDKGEDRPSVDVIFSAEDSRNAPIDESDAFKRDVNTRPDEVSSLSRLVAPRASLTCPPFTSQSTLDDYARVPVGEFGAAMLRGMGWKPGQAASRSGRAGPVEAFVPKSRPAMLGIGAKPIADVLGPETGKNGKPIVAKRQGREEMKFMPLAKKAREGTGSGAVGSIMNGGGGGGPSNGGASGRGRSPPPPPSRSGMSRRPSFSPPPPSRSSRDEDRRQRRDDEDSSRRRERDRDDRDRGSGKSDRSHKERSYRDNRDRSSRDDNDRSSHRERERVSDGRRRSRSPRRDSDRELSKRDERRSNKDSRDDRDRRR